MVLFVDPPSFPIHATYKSHLISKLLKQQPVTSQCLWCAFTVSHFLKTPIQHARLPLNLSAYGITISLLLLCVIKSLMTFGDWIKGLSNKSCYQESPMIYPLLFILYFIAVTIVTVLFVCTVLCQIQWKSAFKILFLSLFISVSHVSLMIFKVSSFAQQSFYFLWTTKLISFSFFLDLWFQSIHSQLTSNL